MIDNEKNYRVVRGVADYDKIVAALKAKPGVWFQVFGSTKAECRIVRGKLIAAGAMARVSKHETMYFVHALWPDW